MRGATSSPLQVRLPPLMQGPLFSKLYIRQSGPTGVRTAISKTLKNTLSSLIENTRGYQKVHRLKPAIIQ